MNTADPTRRTWQQYQELARHLLDKFAADFGLDRVEGPQVLPGQRSETDWALDAKGVLQNGEGILIVECRQYRGKKQVQEQIAALAYRILDTGASGAIVVSPLGLQSGAQKVASAENVVSVHLTADSTPEEFSMQFLNKMYVGIVERVIAQDWCDAWVSRKCARCGEQFNPLGAEAQCSTCAHDA